MKQVNTLTRKRSVMLIWLLMLTRHCDHTRFAEIAGTACDRRHTCQDTYSHLRKQSIHFKFTQTHKPYQRGYSSYDRSHRQLPVSSHYLVSHGVNSFQSLQGILFTSLRTRSSDIFNQPVACQLIVMLLPSLCGVLKSHFSTLLIETHFPPQSKINK